MATAIYVSDIFRTLQPTTAESKFFKVPIEYIPIKTTPRAIKQTSTNLKVMKSYRVCSPTTMLLSLKSITER